MDAIKTTSTSHPLLQIKVAGMESVLAALPDFVMVPPVPGLPTRLTGTALWEALQSRAASTVTTIEHRVGVDAV